MISSPPTHDGSIIALNLRRLMARDGLTFDDVVAATGLDERTLRSVARGKSNPHARTLHKLATGLNISIDELFCSPMPSASRRFDRATNTLVQQVITRAAGTFENWTDADFDELYSRFGTGGQLTEPGVIAAAEAMNAKREVLRQASIVLESGHTEILADFVAMLYRRVTTQPNGSER